MRRADPTTLVGGLAVLVFGGVLMAASLGAFDLSFAAFAPLALAAVGATLLASGLTRRD